MLLVNIAVKKLNNAPHANQIDTRLTVHISINKRTINIISQQKAITITP